MSKRTREDFEEIELQISEAEKSEGPDGGAVATMAVPVTGEGNVVYEMEDSGFTALDELDESLVLVVQEGPKLPLTLVEKPCILNGITLNEKIDAYKLEQLIASDLLQDDPDWNEKNQLKKYNERVHNGTVRVTYNKQKGNPFGRCFPDGGVGLAYIRKEIRHTLAKGLFVDWDIKNCHPVLLRQTLNANGIPCPCLEEYVDNRDEALANVMKDYGVPRDSAKVLFIAVMYLGTFEAWAEKNKVGIPIKPWIQNFIDELSGIADIICEANPTLVGIVQKTKAEKGKLSYNLRASVMSNFLQEYESRCLEVIYHHTRESKRIPNNVCVLCSDGLMIEAEFSTPNLAIEYTQAVQDVLGFKLDFEVKALDAGYDKLHEHIIFDMHKNPAFTTGNVANNFKMIYGHMFKHVDGKTYYYNGVSWVTDEKLAYLHNFIDGPYYEYLLHQTLKGLKACEKRIDAKKPKLALDAPTAALGPVPTQICAPTPVPSAAPSASIMPKAKKSKVAEAEMVLARLKEREEEDADPDLVEQKQYHVLLEKSLNSLREVRDRSEYIRDIQHKLTDDSIEFDSNPYLFAFTDRILDLRTNKWQEKPDPLDFVCTTTGYTYNPNQSPLLKRDLLVVLRKILPNRKHFTYYFTILASGLCGLQVTYFIVANGVGGNGKTVIHQLTGTTLGDYAYVLPAVSLQVPIQGGGNPQLASLHKKRFVVCSEPQKGSICTSVVKEITGNKTLPVRQLYSNKVGAEMNLTLVLECNAKPPLDAVDDGVNRRMRMVNFPSKFLNPDMLKQAIELGITENIYPQDLRCNLDSWRIEYRQALFEVLRDHFRLFVKDGVCVVQMPNQPEEFRELTTDYLATSDDMWGWFTSKYEKTEDSVDNILSIRELFEDFSSSDFFQLMTKSDKRANNLKRFTERCNQNIFLAQIIKRCNQWVVGVKLTADSVVGWAVKVVHGIVESDSISMRNV